MSIDTVLIDNRWGGNTGIGRLLREIKQRTPAGVQTKLIDEKFDLGSPLTPLFLKRKVNSSGADIFYSPSFMPPLQSTVPFIITIHDLNHLYFYTKFHKLYLKYAIAYIAKKSKRIITVSEYTKGELVDKLGLDAKKIDVIYNGVDPNYSLNTQCFETERPYFLYVGNRREYKNLDRTFAAFARANIASDYLLLITGNSDEHTLSLITRHNLNDKVRFLGSVNEADLPKIYKGATALLFVSLMEGFGLPVIEAMASETPVITSNITSLPEIAGDAALLTDPYNIDDISRAIESIADSPLLRTELKEKGVIRSKAFSWDNTGKQTWDLIRSST
ncbi:glycosyltransferase family 4 protein [Mucilaginibacter pallidiroseus]|uniref:Glycosyltransferase family 4 protein n=1 Tax=Mucilaginibacter pallidiroseus TaxID=2599295 RepID=A0A563UIF0_9SPHI|nr:glycosyltransferase family 1 protein [Mucilaginibacter pallidiroseus]TWR31180.1 glycosyltransferase family 4 protein [Mucilaginibacter pallidiroseus]